MSGATIANPPHPVLQARSFRAHRAWRRTVGRWAGYYVAPLLFFFLLAFFGGHVVEESICLSKRGDPIEDCATVAKWVNQAIWDVLLLAAAFSLSTSIIGKVARARARAAQRGLDARLHQHRAALAHAPAAADDLRRYQDAHQPLLREASNENQLRMAAANHLVLILCAATLGVIHLQQAQYHLSADGELGAIAWRILVLGSPYLALALWGVRPALRLRRGARDLIEQTQAAIAQQEARLERLREGTPDPVPSFSWHRFGAAQPGASQP